MRISKNLPIFALLTVISMLIGLASFSNEVFAADSYVDNMNLTIPVSCSIDGTINTEHIATLQNGTYSASTGSDYENGIGKTTLTVFCNDNNGFSVYVVGYTGDTDSGDNINKLVGQNTGSMVDTKVYESGDSTSNWSMKVNKVTDGTISYLPNNMTIANNYNNWHIVPNTYEQVATYKAETGSSATDTTLGAKLETTYAAYISTTQPADTYQGKVKYVLVHPAPVPLTCNPSGTTISTVICMQDISSTNKSSILASMTEGTAYLLYDSRDEQQYHVAKLADGNIWMLDNLALDPTDSTTAANMNETNTNASAAAITNLLNGGNIDNNEGWSSAAVADVDTGFNSYTAPMINNASKDILVTSYGAAATNGQAKVGIYYNYCAASASTYCYEGGYTINDPEDICPANWRMPTGGCFECDDDQARYGEYYELGIALNLTFDEEWGYFNGNSYQTALSTPLSGYYYNNSASAQNYFGFWWSSPCYTGDQMCNLSAFPSDAQPSETVDANVGNSIRCLSH